ncbi:phage minor head protein [Saccharothrix sp. HUAS TT1]|uniref:phage head morphogenesis protein n=1 Tax=unclassified Saccharothrix TaxID=2593673 RepID=UPI00345BE06A
MPGPAQRLRAVADDAQHRMAPAVTSAFRDYLAAARTAVLQPDQLSAAPRDVPAPRPQARPPAGLWTDLVRQRLLPVAQVVFRRAWRSQLTAATARVLDSSAHVALFLADTAARLTGATWSDDVHQAVREQVDRAHREHLPLGELRELVSAALSLPAWSPRAETIARTEALAAVNAGAHASGLARIDVLGEPLRKRWLATRDTRTRPAHRDVDGTTVDADAPFTVGGEQLLYPHDPRGSAAATVNCRCLVLWLDPLEEDRYTALDQHREDTMSDPEPAGDPVATGSPVTAAAVDTTTSSTTPSAAGTAEPAGAERTAAHSGDHVPGEEPPTTDGTPAGTGTGQDGTVEGRPLTAAQSRMPDDLHDYWVRGEGAAEIRWGTKGSFDRCRRRLREHVDNDTLDGLCANLHHDATGKWPSEGKGRAASATDDEVVYSGDQLAALAAAMTTSPTAQAASAQFTAALAARPAHSGRHADAEDDDGEFVNRTGPTDRAVRDAEDDAEDEADDEDRDEDQEEDEDDRDDEQVITDTEVQDQPEVQVRRGVRPEPRTRRRRVTAAATSQPAASPPAEPAPTATLTAAPRTITPPRPGARSITTPAPAPAMTSADTSPGGQGDDEPWAVRVARQVPMEPDPDAFRQEPGPRGTKMHVVNEQGWVAGFIADWDARHRVYNVPPPHDPYGGGYPKFHRHSVRTADGGRVLTGPIAANGHGDTAQTDVWAVMQHYDDPRHVVANVVVRETPDGIWGCGALRAGVTPFQIALLDTYSQSGHWMPGPSGYAEELVASCCVTVEAFELPPAHRLGVQPESMAAAAATAAPRLEDLRQEALVDDDGRCLVLVAAGVLVPDAPPAGPSDQPVDGARVFRQFKHAQRADEQITAARRRIITPRVMAAAARIGKEL